MAAHALLGLRQAGGLSAAAQIGANAAADDSASLEEEAPTARSSSFVTKPPSQPTKGSLARPAPARAATLPAHRLTSVPQRAYHGDNSAAYAAGAALLGLPQLSDVDVGALGTVAIAAAPGVPAWSAKSPQGDARGRRRPAGAPAADRTAGLARELASATGPDPVEPSHVRDPGHDAAALLGQYKSMARARRHLGVQARRAEARQHKAGLARARSDVRPAAAERALFDAGDGSAEARDDLAALLADLSGVLDANPRTDEVRRAMAGLVHRGRNESRRLIETAAPLHAPPPRPAEAAPPPPRAPAKEPPQRSSSQGARPVRQRSGLGDAARNVAIQDLIGAPTPAPAPRLPSGRRKATPPGAVAWRRRAVPQPGVPKPHDPADDDIGDDNVPPQSGAVSNHVGHAGRAQAQVRAPRADALHGGRSSSRLLLEDQLRKSMALGRELGSKLASGGAARDLVPDAEDAAVRHAKVYHFLRTDAAGECRDPANLDVAAAPGRTTPLYGKRRSRAPDVPGVHKLVEQLIGGYPEAPSVGSSDDERPPRSGAASVGGSSVGNPAMLGATLAGLDVNASVDAAARDQAPAPRPAPKNARSLPRGRLGLPKTGVAREAEDARAQLEALADALFENTAAVQEFHRAVQAAATDPMGDPTLVEVPPAVGHLRRMAQAFERRVGGKTCVDRVCDAVGHVLVTLDPQRRQALVQGLIMIQEMPLLKFLQETFLSARSAVSQRNLRRRLDDLVRAVDLNKI
ncbi:unnamed protein product [Pedinophyceae sp. YPF-701]|nr:unnamed protein product [Pedinophyceae sp. YPF-701]